MFFGGCPMVPEIPPRKRARLPCQDDSGTKIIADLAAPFLEELAKLDKCNELDAEINGNVYNIRLCTKNKKKKKKTRSSGGSRKSGGNGGTGQKVCDCNLPDLCCGNDGPDRAAIESEERMNITKSLCRKMMREMFVKKYDQQQQEDKGGVRMVEIPVMFVPSGGMPAMGSGMPGMGGGGGPPGQCGCQNR